MTRNRFFFQDGFGDLCKLYVLLESQTLTSSREEKAAGCYQGEWRKLFIFVKSSGIFQILPIIFWLIRREHRSWLESKQRRLGRGPLGDGPEGGRAARGLSPAFRAGSSYLGNLIPSGFSQRCKQNFSRACFLKRRVISYPLVKGALCHWPIGQHRGRSAM